MAPSGYVKIAIENGPCIVVYPLKMVIFHSYVSLPEGNSYKLIHGHKTPITKVIEL